MGNQNDIKISIPKPCHEDWDKMEPNEKGAFCMKCAKTVVDFTKKTTGEIKDFLTAQSGKKICGRFLNDQLDEPRRVNFKIPLNLLPRRLSFSNSFVFALFISFGTTLFSCRTVEGDIVGEISAVVDTTDATAMVIPDNKITGDTVIIEKPEMKVGEMVARPADKINGNVVCLPKDTTVNVKGDVKVGKMKVNKE